MPTSVPSDERASLRWCQALATTLGLSMARPFAHGIAVENLLGRDRKDCRHEGDQPGPRQHSAVEHRPDGPDAVDEDSDAHDSQRHADEDRGQGFVLAVAVVVPSSRGLAEIRAKTITTTSVARSENECTASATIAPLRPKTPAASLASDSTRLTAKPTRVTR